MKKLDSLFKFLAAIVSLGLAAHISAAPGTPAGTVAAWGSNHSGETTVPIAARAGVTAIAAGSSHTLALKEDGSVVAWPGAGAGQVPAAAQNGVIAIAARSVCSVALKSDGSVIAWGKWGPAGDGGTWGPISVPVQAQSGVIAIAAGESHTLALKADGTVLAWDTNRYGQLDVPAGLAGVVAIAAGNHHNLALKADGSLATWGSFWDDRDTAARLPNLRPEDLPVRAIAAGRDYSVAVTSSGRVVAISSFSNPPGGEPPLEAQSGVVAVAAGGGTCGGFGWPFIIALKDDGSVIAWGDDDRYGQISSAAGLINVHAIAAGESHGVALGTPTPPRLVTQPTNQTVTVLQRAEFNVSASGFPLHYQWRKDGMDIPGATAPTFNPGTPHAHMAGAYTVVVTNASGTVTSEPAILRVEPVSPGTVVGWGINSSDIVAVPLTAQSGVVAIADSGQDAFPGIQGHTVVLKSDGSVEEWRYFESETPVPLADRSGVTAISAGVYHTMALKNDGSVVEWGWNETLPSATQSGVVAISGGIGYSAALKNDGSVVLWGAAFPAASIIPPSSSNSIVAIAAGNQIAALQSDGSVVVLADGRWDQSSIPPAARNGVMAIAAGGSGEVLVLKTNGVVTAWGNEMIIPIEAQSGVKAIAAGTRHYAALKTDGSVVVWGPNGRMDAPPGLTGVTAVAAGHDRTFAVLGPQHPPSLIEQPINQTVHEYRGAIFTVDAQGYPLSYQWRKDGIAIAGATGANYSLPFAQMSQAGQYTVVVSNPSGSVTSAPVTLVVKAPLPGSVVVFGALWDGEDYVAETVPSAAHEGVTAIAVGGYHTMALKLDGTVLGWGNNDSGQTTLPPNLSGIAALAAGGNHSAAVRKDGSVVAWGGQAFRGVPETAQTGVIAIAVGYDHTVALKTNGSVVVWGDNTYGQLNIPASARDGVSAIAGGGFHSLALKNDGSVVAWGAGGTATETWPDFGQSVVPEGLTEVIAVAAGFSHSLALKKDGSVVAWGLGSVKNGFPNFGQALVPIEAQSGVKAIAAGYRHSVALKEDGSVIAWGAGVSNTGTLPEFGQSRIPVGLTGVTAISAGGDRTAVLLGTAQFIPTLSARVSAMK